MRAIASQIIGISSVCSTVCSSVDQGKHLSSASLAFARGIHRWSVDSPHKGPVTRKMFPFVDVIMITWSNAYNVCHLDPWGQTSMNFVSNHNNFHSRKCIWKCHLQNEKLTYRCRNSAKNAWDYKSLVQRSDRNMMTSSNGNIFRVTGHLYGESTGHRWIPHRKASDAELWCFLWYTLLLI